MRAFFLILGAVLLTAVLVSLQLAALRRRHPNAELLVEALKSIAGRGKDS